jgi:predicted ATPase/class 3 adenylate cyclase
MMVDVRRELPTGTVTFLFTDVASSTALLVELGTERYADALAEHRRVLRETFRACGGVEVDTQGDAFFVAFPTAPAAVRAATQAALALSSGPIQVRIGIHTGTPLVVDDGYIGIDVHQAARIAAAGHGGQVLVSGSTEALLRGEELRDLGEHRLKDLSEPQRLYQLMVPGLQREFPVLSILASTPINLPTPSTSLIGREQELADTADLLRRAEIRLLTLSGAGGTGKTRLALQLAADLVEEFPDGVFFVDLASIGDSSLVFATIAETLAVRERPGESLETTLVEYLRQRRLLLLLDNFEQLVAAAPRLAALLGGAPHLKLLVTSRAALRVAAEQEYVVRPLELPPVEHAFEIAALSKYEAIRLFVERARSVRAEFELTSQNARAVAEICVRLDGLPLAIELAAARIRTLSPQALSRLLEQRLKLLVAGSRDAPARQQTLRATFDWSCGLLTRPEQRVLSRLSVFVGGCDLSAAEAVCDVGDSLSLDVLDGLSSLIENNLVVEHEDSRGEPRYSMLESIREYASEMISLSDDADALRLRHAEYFGAAIDQEEPSMHYLAPTARRRAITKHHPTLDDAPEERAQRELSNLRAALQWTFQAGEFELALRLAVAASWGWALNSAYTEARTWITRILQRTEHLRTIEQAAALFWLAEFAAWQGDYRTAEALNERARALFELHDDQIGVFRSLLGLTQFEVNLGDLERARAVLSEADKRAESLRSDHERAWLYFKAAQVESLAGEYEQAHSLLEQGLQLCRILGVPRRQWINQLINVGWFALEQLNLTRARSALQEYLSEHSGKTPSGIASAYDGLAMVALYEGDRDEADQRFRRSLALAHEAGARRTIAAATYGLAAVAAIDGDSDRSARLWAAADAIRQSTSSPLSTQEQFIVERYLESAKARLAGGVNPTHQADKAQMKLDDALTWIRVHLDSSPHPDRTI